jgi:tetratricopeptide (TPR) repeat protein
MLELGRARGEAALFQGALALLEELGRLADQSGDRPMLARARTAQGRVRLALGEADPALRHLRSAVELAEPLDAPALLAECQLHLGIGLSWGQRPGWAQDFLEAASETFDRLGDSRAAQARAWQARNLAALGDHGLAELLLLRVAESEGPPGPAERGERVFLDGENAEFRSAWGEARRHYQAAGNRFAHAGLVWRELLARLRCIQAEAGEMGQEGLRRPTSLALAWARLEQLQAPVAAAGSPWLGLEWLRAQASLLAGPGGDATDPGPAAAAWGEVLAGARALGFPALALEAGARCSELLLGLGERQGARARIEEALPSAEAWWAQLPPGVPGDLHGFRQAAEHAGIHIPWPDRAAGLAN